MIIHYKFNRPLYHHLILLPLSITSYQFPNKPKINIKIHLNYTYKPPSLFSHSKQKTKDYGDDEQIRK